MSRQCIFDTGRHLRKDGPAHEADFLELAQLPRQHTLSDFRQAASQLIEAQCSLQEMLEDDRFPFSVDQIQGCFHGTSGCAIVLLREQVLHGSLRDT